MSRFANGRRPDAGNRPHDPYLSRASCLICGTVVALDPEKIEERSDYATVPCTACSALVPIPLADAVRAIEEQSSRVDGHGKQAILGAWHRR
jgi:hypothetical protein